MLKVTNFDWDDGNAAKCKKHGLSIAQVESLFDSDELFVAPDIKHSGSEQRLFAVGILSNGRHAFVAFTYRKEKIRPISARYMHQKERLQYEKIIAEIKD